MRKQILDDLTTALTRDQLPFVQIDKKAFDSLAITRSLVGANRKLSKIFCPTTLTLFLHYAMLCNFQLQRRQIKDLPALIKNSSFHFFQTRAAKRTTLGLMQKG